MVKIYTKNGDEGSTSLLFGAKTSKAEAVFEVLGTLDEFNAFIALCDLQDIQRDLLQIGGVVANPNAVSKDYLWLNVKVKKFEKQIDLLDSKLPSLKNFILAGGTEKSKYLNLARVVCRRLERVLVSYYFDKKVGREPMLKYFNRLSDLLFVLSRYDNFMYGIDDVLWKK
ncbi:MAG: ATP/cobalamin adenosyltransferase [uncultured bacterium]|nr:MAG: ATP/cobalamin adenosyltransferase [uncultured bacterium]